MALEVRPRGTDGPHGLDRLLHQRGLRAVDLADWRAIDSAERARASGIAPRTKFHTVAGMLELLRDRQTCETSTENP
jgi:hypothetical protein